MISPYYFDYAAATPVDDRVLVSMQPFWQEQFYNPSALYLAGKEVAKSISDARSRVAKVLGAKPSEVIFTAGGTESNNLAISGVMRQFPDAHIVVSAVEHEAVLNTAKQYDYSIAAVDRTGQLITGDNAFKNSIQDNTVLVSVMHANNEVGSVQPLAAIKKIVLAVRQQRHASGNDLPLYLHVDASQTACYLDLHIQRLQADLVTINGGKMYGPKQTGILYKSTAVRLRPQILGGGQEWGVRSGTENVPGIVGFATAIEIAQASRKKEVERLRELQSVFIHELTMSIPKVIVNNFHGLPNFVHITIPDTDNERLVMELDEHGIMCAVGSACSASSDEPSHVLAAMGMNRAAIRSSIRFSMGRYTTKKAILETVQKLATLCQ